MRRGINIFYRSNDVVLNGRKLDINSYGVEGYSGIPIPYDMFLNFGLKVEFFDFLNNDPVYFLFTQLVKEFNVNDRLVPYIHAGIDTSTNTKERSFNVFLGVGLDIPLNDSLSFNLALNYHYRNWYNLPSNTSELSDSGLGVTVGLVF